MIPPRKNAKPLKDKQARSMKGNELLKTVKHIKIMIWKSGLAIIYAV